MYKHPMNMVRDQTVYKYCLGNKLGQEVTIKLPVGAKVIKVAFQNEEIHIWVLRHEEPRWLENRTFLVTGTGWNIPFPMEVIHLDSIFEDDFVWHVFEVE